MEIIKVSTISIDKLAPNEGQIPDVPANPRTITEEEYEYIKQSIEDDPEMLELRELLVYEYDGRYVIICGNMRYRAMLELGYTEAYCKIIPKEATTKQLRAYTLKDNVQYGAWDDKEIEKEWKDCIDPSWGLSEFESDRGDEEELLKTLELTFSPEQFKFVTQRLREFDGDRSVALKLMLEEYGKQS